jgi:hypothetical protein
MAAANRPAAQRKYSFRESTDWKPGYNAPPSSPVKLSPAAHRLASAIAGRVQSMRTALEDLAQPADERLRRERLPLGRPSRGVTGRSQQHQKQRAIALVPGGGPASFRSLHDGAAIGRAQAPPAGPAALSQSNFKKRKLLRHRIVCLCFAAQVQVFMKKILKPQTTGNSFPPSQTPAALFLSASTWQLTPERRVGRAWAFGLLGACPPDLPCTGQEAACCGRGRPRPDRGRAERSATVLGRGVVFFVCRERGIRRPDRAATSIAGPGPLRQSTLSATLVARLGSARPHAYRPAFAPAEPVLRDPSSQHRGDLPGQGAAHMRHAHGPAPVIAATPWQLKSLRTRPRR